MGGRHSPVSIKSSLTPLPFSRLSAPPGLVPDSERQPFVVCLRASLPARTVENAGDPRSTLWVGKIPWRREQQPTPVFLPGESPLENPLIPQG